jgi:hypothetical protein
VPSAAVNLDNDTNVVVVQKSANKSTNIRNDYSPAHINESHTPVSSLLPSKDDILKVYKALVESSQVGVHEESVQFVHRDLRTRRQAIPNQSSPAVLYLPLGRYEVKSKQNRKLQILAKPIKLEKTFTLQ